MEGLWNLMSSLNPYVGGKCVNGLLMLTMNLGTSYLIQEVIPIANRIFQYRLFRYVVLFAIFLTATRDVPISILMTFIGFLFIVFFLNETSWACLIPYEYRKETGNPDETQKKESFRNYSQPTRRERYDTNIRRLSQ
jgi:hypothetical protein